MDEFQTFLIIDNATGDSYYFTGISNVSGGKSSTITQYSTPSGIKISDHLFVNPRQLSFKLTTSKIAMNPNKRITKSRFIDKEFNTVKNIKDTLNTWLEEGHRLTITTFEDRYTNMVLWDIRVTEDESGIGGWSPSLSFKEVRVATPEYITLPGASTNNESAAGNGEQPLGESNGVTAGDIGETIGSTAAGALVGAAIGSIFPGPGTAIGAAIGSVVGFFSSLF